MNLWFRGATVAALAGLATPFAGGTGQHPKEIKGWGTVTDPDGDCTFKEDKGKLIIAVPAGFHDLQPDRAMNAARVLREVEGDFTATVKVACVLTPGEASIKGRTAGYFAGLLLWAGDKGYIRLERNAMRSGGTGKPVSFRPLFEYWKDGKVKPAKRVGPLITFNADANWFKLERKGATVTASYSDDGKEWVATFVADAELPKKVHIGVAAFNTSDTPFAAEFAGLKVADGKQ
jgi:hypothetical protein